MTRAEPLTGVAAAVLILAGFAVLAVPPEPSATAAEVVEYLESHRGRVFLSACLVGTGDLLFLWFLGMLRADGVADAAVLGGLAGLVVVLVAMGVLSGLVLHVEEIGGAVAVAGFDVYNALITLGGFGFALLAFGAALRGRWRRAGLVVAGLQLATIPGLFAQSGFFAAGGAMALLAFWALSAYFIAIALRMRREMA